MLGVIDVVKSVARLNGFSGARLTSETRVSRLAAGGGVAQADIKQWAAKGPVFTRSYFSGRFVVLEFKPGGIAFYMTSACLRETDLARPQGNKRAAAVLEMQHGDKLLSVTYYSTDSKARVLWWPAADAAPSNIPPPDYQIFGGTPVEWLHQRLQRSRIALISVLTDWRRVSLVDNETASEALWRAGINPMIPFYGVDVATLKLVLRSCEDIITAGAMSPTGAAVPGIWKQEACGRCGSPSKKTTLRDRVTVYWCPRCQPSVKISLDVERAINYVQAQR